jgi:GT2 family glycosyltransferase
MINILIVLYKKRFAESETLINITNISESGILKNSKIIIWDNSPNAINEQEFDALKQEVAAIDIIHTPENLSISKIYNRVIDNYLKKGDYLILLDHDTNVTAEYFTEVIEKTSQHTPPYLLLPQIMVQDVIESPAYQYILFSKKWQYKTPGSYSSKYVTAINSGMVIAESFFAKGFRYDERLLFYGTDSYMMFNYSKLNTDFYLLNSKLIHDLNLQSNSSIIAKAKIFKEIKRANLIVYSSNFFFASLARINNLIIALKYSLKYASFIFFK